MTTDRRAEILDATVVVCARSGYGGATLREIAAAAGMKKGLLTYYFPTKDDLVAEVVLDVHRRFEVAVDDWLGPESLDAGERLRRWLQGHARLTCAHPDRVRVAYECAPQLSAGRRREIDASRSRYEERLVGLVDECRASVPIADVPTPLLVRIALGVVTWPYQWLGDEPISAPDEIERLAATIADRAFAAVVDPNG